MFVLFLLCLKSWGRRNKAATLDAPQATTPENPTMWEWFLEGFDNYCCLPLFREAEDSSSIHSDERSQTPSEIYVHVDTSKSLYTVWIFATVHLCSMWCICSEQVSKQYKVSADHYISTQSSWQGPWRPSIPHPSFPVGAAGSTKEFSIERQELLHSLLEMRYVDVQSFQCSSFPLLSNALV